MFYNMIYVVFQNVMSTIKFRITMSTFDKAISTGTGPIKNTFGKQRANSSTPAGSKSAKSTPVTSTVEPTPITPKAVGKTIKEKGKRVNVRNKNIDAQLKIDERSLFIQKMQEANGLPKEDYPSLKDVTSVLINNKLPMRAVEGRNLNKFFSKRKTERAPSKDVYLAMKRAIESNNLQPTRSKVANMVSAAEKQKINEAVVALSTIFDTPSPVFAYLVFHRKKLQ